MLGSYFAAEVVFTHGSEVPCHGMRRRQGHNEIVGIRTTIELRRREILDLASRHGASQVRLFGSVARGDESVNSDVDFLVVLEPGRSLMDHAALKIALEELLGMPVDVATERGLKPKFRDRILSEAVAL